mmetsp:Transcript_11685/g.33636  ORF Transcript_11685/g.33636 Transcript_11685/m.33636 type:complete len:264 (+) Transcript_11685:2-793(+)
MRTGEGRPPPLSHAGGASSASRQRKSRSSAGVSTKHFAVVSPRPTFTERHGAEKPALNIASSEMSSPAASTASKGVPVAARLSQMRRTMSPFVPHRREASTVLLCRDTLVPRQQPSDATNSSRRAVSADAAASAAASSLTARKCHTTLKAFSSIWLPGQSLHARDNSERIAECQSVVDVEGELGLSGVGLQTWNRPATLRSCSAMSTTLLYCAKWPLKNCASRPLTMCTKRSSRRLSAAKRSCTSCVGTASSGVEVSSRRVPS